MSKNKSIYKPIIEALDLGQCVEFSEQAHGAAALGATELNTLRHLVNRMNARDPASKSRLCVRTFKQHGAAQVYRIPKFTMEYIMEIRKVKEQASA